MDEISQDILASFSQETPVFDASGIGIGGFDLDPALFDAPDLPSETTPLPASSPAARDAPFVDYLNAPSSPDFRGPAAAPQNPPPKTHDLDPSPPPLPLPGATTGQATTTPDPSVLVAAAAASATASSPIPGSVAAPANPQTGLSTPNANLPNNIQTPAPFAPLPIASTPKTPSNTSPFPPQPAPQQNPPPHHAQKPAPVFPGAQPSPAPALAPAPAALSASPSSSPAPPPQSFPATSRAAVMRSPAHVAAHAAAQPSAAAAGTPSGSGGGRKRKAPEDARAQEQVNGLAFAAASQAQDEDAVQSAAAEIAGIISPPASAQKDAVAAVPAAVAPGAGRAAAKAAVAAAAKGTLPAAAKGTLPAAASAVRSAVVDDVRKSPALSGGGAGGAGGGKAKVANLSSAPAQQRAAAATEGAVKDAGIPGMPAALQSKRKVAPAVEEERKRLREPANKLVASAWRAALPPSVFVANARTNLRVPADPAVSQAPQWQLSPGAETALLDVLLERITVGEAASTRLLGYLRHALVAGLVSQRAVLDACISSFSGLSERVATSLARLLAEMLPFFSFSGDDAEVTVESHQFLNAFTLVLSCGASSPALVPVVVSLLASDRVVALVRAAARRAPEKWTPIYGALARMEAVDADLAAGSAREAGGNGVGEARPAKARRVTAPKGAQSDLRLGIGRLRYGLHFSITTFQMVATAMHRPAVAKPGAQLVAGLTSVSEVAGLVFGGEVGHAMRAFWSSREVHVSDLLFLKAIEHKASASVSSGSMSRLDFRDRVRACEAIVRYLAECAAVPKMGDQWNHEWGGLDRLTRLLRDALPQVKRELRSVFGCLMVATTVIGSAALCLGPALQLDAANSGIPEGNPAVAARRVQMNEIVEDVMGELSGFAVACLEEAAVAEEMPAWRSLGVWLLLLSSRCGSMLRASRCNHVRAARVLTAWGGSPNSLSSSRANASSYYHQASSGASRAKNGRTATGNPSTGDNSRGGSGATPSHQGPGKPPGPPSRMQARGPPSSGGGVPTGGSQRHGNPPSGGSGNNNAVEGVIAFAAVTALAVMDASDVRGDNATLRLLA